MAPGDVARQADPLARTARSDWPSGKPRAATALPKLQCDLTNPRAVDAWHDIDDHVMGGVSLSRLRCDADGQASWHGSV
jgi:hypothetical protein